MNTSANLSDNYDGLDDRAMTMNLTWCGDILERRDWIEDLTLRKWGRIVLSNEGKVVFNIQVLSPHEETRNLKSPCSPQLIAYESMMFSSASGRLSRTASRPLLISADYKSKA